MRLLRAKLLKVLVFLTVFMAKDAFAISLGLNPYAGTGQISDGSTVKSATGIRGSLEKTWPVSKRWLIGPRMEIGNTYLNTKDEQDGRRVLSTYDNRFLVGGMHFGALYDLGGKFNHEAYLTLCTGRAIAKLSQDESGEDYFAQKQYKDIKGFYYTSELGTNLQVRRDIAFNFSVIGNYFNAEVGKAKGSMSGEYANKEGVFPLTDDEKESSNLPDTVVQKIVTLSFGLNITL